MKSSPRRTRPAGPATRNRRTSLAAVALLPATLIVACADSKSPTPEEVREIALAMDGGVAGGGATSGPGGGPTGGGGAGAGAGSSGVGAGGAGAGAGGFGGAGEGGAGSSGVGAGGAGVGAGTSGVGAGAGGAGVGAGTSGVGAGAGGSGGATTTSTTTSTSTTSTSTTSTSTTSTSTTTAGVGGFTGAGGGSTSGAGGFTGSGGGGSASGAGGFTGSGGGGSASGAGGFTGAGVGGGATGAGGFTGAGVGGGATGAGGFTGSGGSGSAGGSGGSGGSGDGGGAPECLGEYPDIPSANWSWSKSYASKKWTCPNGKKASISWDASLSASAGANANDCSVTSNIQGGLSVAPELCGKLGFNGGVTVSGTANACKTPDCIDGILPICTDPSCVAGNVNATLTLGLSATWDVGELVPQARPLCNGKFVKCEISIAANGTASASRDAGTGTGSCGCCDDGKTFDYVTLYGNLNGSVTGRLVVDVGWLGYGELEVTGSACVSGQVKDGETCDGPTSELTGGWQVSASANGQVCLGKPGSFFSYCKGFSGGPWTAGPGCQ